MEGFNFAIGVKEVVYFAVLIAALGYCAIKAGESVVRGRVTLFLLSCYGFTLFALFITWSNIFEFMAKDIQQFESFEVWLKTSKVFERAYLMVTEDVFDWWWSGQLLLWITPGILYMQITKARLAGPWAAAFVFVAFLGAVSVGCAMFFIATTFALPREGRSQASNTKGRALHLPLATWLCYALALISGLLTPAAKHLSLFKTNLLFLHAIFFLPLLFAPPRMAADGRPKPSFFAVSAVHAFYLCAGVCFTAHFNNCIAVVTAVKSGGGSAGTGSVLEVLQALAYHGFDHPCQAGISWDVVLTTVLTMALIWRERQGAASWVLLLLTPILSAPVTLSLHCAAVESARSEALPKPHKD